MPGRFKTARNMYMIASQVLAGDVVFVLHVYVVCVVVFTCC